MDKIGHSIRSGLLHRFKVLRQCCGRRFLERGEVTGADVQCRSCPIDSSTSQNQRCSLPCRCCPHIGYPGHQTLTVSPETPSVTSTVKAQRRCRRYLFTVLRFRAGIAQRTMPKFRKPSAPLKFEASRAVSARFSSTLHARSIFSWCRTPNPESSYFSTYINIHGRTCDSIDTRDDQHPQHTSALQSQHLYLQSEPTYTAPKPNRTPKIGNP